MNNKTNEEEKTLLFYKREYAETIDLSQYRHKTET